MKGRLDFTPEQEFLFWAIQEEEQLPGHLAGFLRHDAAWESLRVGAGRHGILPLVFRRLKAVDQLVPAREMARFRDLYLAIAGNNLAREMKLLSLMELLASRGVESLVFKGPALALEAYGDSSLRQYVDLDILIRRTDFRTAYQAMVEAGYTPQYQVDGKIEQWLVRSAIELEFEGKGGLQVEIHWDICERSSRFDLGEEKVWEHSHSVVMHGREVRTLSPADNLVMLWLHGFRHRWESLKLVADLLRMVRTCGEKDRNIILDACAKLPHPYRDRFMGDVENPRGLATAVFFPRSYQNAVDRFKDLASEVFIPKPTDWLAVDLPDRLYPLYYLIRPIRLALKYGGSLLR